eukprot:2939206-Rhodomonas_salina.1
MARLRVGIENEYGTLTQHWKYLSWKRELRAGSMQVVKPAASEVYLTHSLPMLARTQRPQAAGTPPASFSPTIGSL